MQDVLKGLPWFCHMMCYNTKECICIRYYVYVLCILYYIHYAYVLCVYYAGCVERPARVLPHDVLQYQRVYMYYVLCICIMHNVFYTLCICIMYNVMQDVPKDLPGFCQMMGYNAKECICIMHYVYVLCIVYYVQYAYVLCVCYAGCAKRPARVLPYDELQCQGVALHPSGLFHRHLERCHHACLCHLLQQDCRCKCGIVC